MLYMIFQYGGEPVLILQILIGFEDKLEICINVPTEHTLIQKLYIDNGNVFLHFFHSFYIYDVQSNIYEALMSNNIKTVKKFFKDVLFCSF